MQRSGSGAGASLSSSVSPRNDSRSQSSTRQGSRDFPLPGSRQLSNTNAYGMYTTSRPSLVSSAVEAAQAVAAAQRRDAFSSHVQNVWNGDIERVLRESESTVSAETAGSVVKGQGQEQEQGANGGSGKNEEGVIGSIFESPLQVRGCAFVCWVFSRIRLIIPFYYSNNAISSSYSCTYALYSFILTIMI